MNENVQVFSAAIQHDVATSPSIEPNLNLLNRSVVADYRTVTGAVEIEHGIDRHVRKIFLAVRALISRVRLGWSSSARLEGPLGQLLEL